MKTSLTAWLFLLLIMLYVIILATNTLYPFIDLPNHLAEAMIFKLANEPTFANFYSVRDGIDPNSFHYWFCSLFETVELGNKIYYILYAILLPITTVLLIRQHGGNWKFGFLSLLLIFNYNVSFGFAGFTMAIPVVLFSFYLLGINTLMSRVILAVALIALFYTHVLALLFMLFLILVISFVNANNVKTFITYCWVVIPALILIAVWQVHAFNKEESTLTFLYTYYTQNYFQELYLRGKIFIYDNFVLAPGVKGVVLAGVFFLVIFIPVATGLLKFNSKEVLNFSKAHKQAVAFLVVSFICCFFLPGELPGQGILYHRFSVFLLISLILLGSILYPDGVSRAFQIIGVLTVVIHAALWYDYFYDFNKQNKSFNASFFDKVPRDQPLGGVMIDYNYRGRPVYIHFSNYHIVWNKGIATTKVIDYRFGSIKRVASKTILPEYQEWAGTAGLIPTEYSNLKYLLLRGDPLNLPKDASFLKEDKQWRIVKLN